MQIALLSSLQDANGNIEILTTRKGDYLKMKSWPETFWSDYGYIDPSRSMKESDVENLPDEEEIAE